MAARVRWKIIGDTCINGLMAYVCCEINAYSPQYSMTTPKKRRNLYTSSSKYRNWPRLGLWSVGICSLGLSGLRVGLCKRNSVLNVALYAERTCCIYCSVLNSTARHVNGDTSARPPTTPVDTVSSGSHSDGSASARPSGNFDSHSNSQDHVRTPSDSLSDLQSDNSVNDYRATVIHPSNQTVSRFHDRLTVTNSRTFYAAVSHKLSRVTLSQSLLNSISQLQLIH